MLGVHRARSENTTNFYATSEDFKHFFTAENESLLRLSLWLTANAEKAAYCLTLAMKDCSQSKAISKLFTHVWARRMVIRNAIHLVQCFDRDTAGHVEEVDLHTSESQEEEQPSAILHLPKFDRLAFVICVLERLSILDCALLLRISPKDVNEAIARAVDRMASVPLLCGCGIESNDSHGARHSPQKLSSVGC